MQRTWEGMLCSVEWCPLPVYDGGFDNLGIALGECLLIFAFSGLFDNRSQDRRLATIDTPPDRLNLAEKCSRQAVIKRRQVTQATSAPATVEAPAATGSVNEAMPQWAQVMVAMMSGIGIAARTNYPYYHQPPHHAERSPSHSPPLAARQVYKRPSSNDGIDMEFPELKPWLEAIEKDLSRNKYGETFSQFAASLVDTHKLFTLKDIVSISAQDIATYGPMEFGTASRILRFAKEDINGLKMRRKKVRQ